MGGDEARRWLPGRILVVVVVLLSFKVWLAPNPDFSSSASAPLAIIHPSSTHALLGVDDLCSSARNNPGDVSPTHTTLRDKISNSFSSIYANHLWTSDGQGSGAGSTLKGTVTMRAKLEMLMYRHHITSVLDVPCGSSHWWPPLLASIRTFIPCYRYHGIDIVESVISQNKKKYAGDALTSFERVDVSSADLPRNFDLTLTRDALQHLPLLVAIDVIENVARAKPRLALFGTYLRNETLNFDISVGEYFSINLMIEPFLMTSPEDIITESNSPRPEKFLLLFTGEYLQTLNFDAMRSRAKRDFKAKETR